MSVTVRRDDCTCDRDFVESLHIGWRMSATLGAWVSDVKVSVCRESNLIPVLYKLLQ